MQTFLQQKPFELDPFQKEAIQYISEGHSVVVCAPTGSGKTIIAEYAAHKALEEGVKLFYTTPLKALSNQKFFDLKQQYGPDNVGLLTGDTTINRDARIIVMTTEIFRNMLYGTYRESDLLQNVGYVVLDECHYMNDAQRGTVWEESIIYCPESIQLIGLSATVANADELTAWINKIHHDTHLVYSDFRPVPLRFSYYDREKISPLFEAPGRINKRLKSHQKGNRFSKHLRVFSPNKLILEMHEKEMLPAIFFTFSRRDCNKHLRATERLYLLTLQERRELSRQIDEFIKLNPYLENNELLPYIRNGFASHHAGLLPGLKHLVESLFQKGLIKAVFATETLAAGINMPARSTVITALSKRTDDGHRLLTANEFLQMSGRAGRRGMDEVGYVVIVSTPYEGAREAATLASSPADPLNSQFTPTYGMVLNLLQKHTLKEAHYLIQRSFGQFTAARRMDPLKEDIDRKTQALKSYLEFECPAGVSDKDFHGFQKSKVMLYETGRFIKILQKQTKQHGKFSEILNQLKQEENKKKNLLKTIQESPCDTCPVIKKHEKAEDRIRRLQKQLKGLNEVYESEKDKYWQQFLSIYNLLKEAEYLDENDIPTAKGKLTGQIRAENEFYISEVVQSGILQNLKPDQLAAVISAVINDSNRETLYSKLDYSHETHYAMMEISGLMKKIKRLQDKHGVDAPLVLNPVTSGLIESWVQGMEWNRLFTYTNMDEGDLVRMARRTADVLRQLTRIDGVPEDLVATARLALVTLYRHPVLEMEIVEAEEATEEPIPEEVLKEALLEEELELEEAATHPLSETIEDSIS